MTRDHSPIEGVSTRRLKHLDQAEFLAACSYASHVPLSNPDSAPSAPPLSAGGMCASALGLHSRLPAPRHLPSFPASPPLPSPAFAATAPSSPTTRRATRGCTPPSSSSSASVRSATTTACAPASATRTTRRRAPPSPPSSSRPRSVSSRAPCAPPSPSQPPPPTLPTSTASLSWTCSRASGASCMRGVQSRRWRWDARRRRTTGRSASASPSGWTRRRRSFPRHPLLAHPRAVAVAVARLAGLVGRVAAVVTGSGVVAVHTVHHALQ